MAYKGISKLLFFFFLSFLTLCSSGTLVGFSYDARRNNAISSPMETISFLKKSKISPTQIRVFVEDNRILDTLANSGVLVDLYLNGSGVDNQIKSKASAISWLKTHLINFLPHINITSIIVSSSSSSSSSSNSVAQKQLPLLLDTMKSVHSALKSFNLNHKVKVSIVFSLSMLENLERQHAKDVLRIVDFIKKCRSFVVLEIEINGKLSMGDDFVRLMVKSATSAANVLPYRGVPIVLNVKSSVIPSAIEVEEFGKKMINSIKSHEHITDRISGFFAEISPMEESEQKELDREEEQIFPSSHRELLNSRPISAMRVALHDNINIPTPVTIPPTNPTPTIVTVPSTNPVSITPVNPAANPVTVPTTTPVVTAPINVPIINPVTPPSTVPPMNNPMPPTVTVPMAPTLPNYPVPPTGGIPITPPVTTPIVNPVAPPAITNPPATSGQTWCVAKTGTTASALQVALDYACGIGGADCSAIQPSGSCYNPNSPQNHASYAFNSYYQKNPAPSSCDFKGAAMLVNTNPSTGSCIYPSSSTPSTPSTPSSSPPPATASSSSPPFVLNSSDPASSTPPIFGTPPIYGIGPPPGLNSSDSIGTGLRPLFASIILAPFIVTGRLCFS